MEHLLVELGEPDLESFILDKPFRKEFKEPSRSIIIALYSRGTKVLSLTLRSAMDQLAPSLALIPQLDLIKSSQEDKEKQLMTKSPTNPSNPMKFIIWNTIGANNTSFIRQCNTLIKAHNPSLVALLETKMVDHKYITESLHFEVYLESSTVDMKGGIVVMWKEDLLYLQHFSILPQGIHTIVKASHNQKPFFSLLFMLVLSLVIDYSFGRSCVIQPTHFLVIGSWVGTSMKS